MKKKIFMSAAKKARIALAVMALCGMSFVGAQEAFAADPLPTTDLAVKTDANKNIICGDGAKAKDSGVKDTIIMGNGAVSMGHDSVVIGSEAKTDDINRNGVFMSSYNSVAIGAKAKAVANDSTAIGYGAVADYSFSTAIGSMAETAAFGLSLGANAKSTVYSDAIGVGAEAKKQYSVAIGFGSVADEENTVSVGSGGVVGTFGPAPKTRRIVNVADGINDHDAATVGQVKNMIAAGGSASFDGTKLNTDIQNVDVAGGYKDTATNPNVDTKGTIAGAINSAYQAGKEYTDTQLTDKVGIIAGGTYVEAGKNVAENIGKLDTQVKANADAIGIANTNITNVDNKIGSLSVDGTYIKKAKNVSENLVALDTQVKANADDIITANTKITTVDNKIGSLSADGKYIKKDNNVSANLVELDKQVNTNTTAIADKADKNLSNISDAGKNVIKDLAGNKAGEVVNTKLGDITSENYVKKDDTVNANISALDKQVKANADAINTKADKDLSNITDAGKNVIKDLAGNKAGEVVDAKLGNITSENYVKKDDTVNANISALDKQMKVNTDNIGDTGKLTTAGLGSNLSDAVVNVNNKVGTADELKALKDAGLGDNLAQATAAVNKKADKNAEDIKTVNGRVDELGGRVDTLGGAVSKLDTKVNKVGAGAAALAALHPMDFDSDNKLTFAAGVGSYHGASAAAIGAFYRPSEQVMFSISSNMGNGENMVNAGVSFALDRPSKTPTTKAALVKTVVAQNEQIAALNETLAEQNEKIARLEAMVEKLAAKQNA